MGVELAVWATLLLMEKQITSGSIRSIILISSQAQDHRLLQMVKCENRKSWTTVIYFSSQRVWGESRLCRLRGFKALPLVQNRRCADCTVQPCEIRRAFIDWKTQDLEDWQLYARSKSGQSFACLLRLIIGSHVMLKIA